MTRKELLSPDMSCNHCKMTIESAVKKLEGISYVNADPETKKVVIEFDEKIVNLDRIKSIIIEAGYGAQG